MSIDPRFPDDELVSAYVDDELDADGRARVEADPALTAEVRTLGHVRRVIADLPPPATDVVRRDAAIRVALAAMGGEVVGFAPVAARHRRRPRWALPALGAAAAALLVVVGLVATNDRQHDGDVASRPTTVVTAAAEDGGPDALTAEARTGGGTATAAADAAPEDAAASASPQPVAGNGATKVGPPSDADVLALRAAAASTAPPGSTATCPTPTPAAAFVGTTTWSSGELVEVFVDRTTEPGTAVAVTPEGCLVLAVLTLA